MVHLPRSAHHLFASQHGVASLDQLLSTGLSRSQLKRLEASGAIVRLINTAYRTPSVPLDEMTRCAAVCLAHPTIVVAGPTAGRLWGFRRLPPDRRVHVLAPPASHPVTANWLVPYRTKAFHDGDVIHRPDGINITSRARTALDLARWLSPDDILSVIEQAIHDGRITDHEMHAVAVDWISSQRPWVRTYLVQLGRRLAGGAAESHPEVRVAHALRNAGVRGLVQQYPVDLKDYGPARFDLAVPDLRWAIEVDVHPVHGETSGKLSDRRRDNAATAEGWSVTRIDRASYEFNFEATIARVADEHRDRRRRSSA